MGTLTLGRLNNAMWPLWTDSQKEVYRNSLYFVIFRECMRNAVANWK